MANNVSTSHAWASDENAQALSQTLHHRPDDLVDAIKGREEPKDICINA
jgi:hypothetical protein